MTAMLKPLAGLAALAGIGAELAGHRGFARLVQQDVRAGAVTEEMLADLPEPVRHYLRYIGVVGRRFPGTVRLCQKAGCGLAQASGGCPWTPRALLGTPARLRLGRHAAPLPSSGGTGPQHVCRGPRVDAGQGGLAVAGGRRQRRADRPGRDDGCLSEMIWFLAAFLADNVSFEPVDDSSARVTPAAAMPRPFH